MVENKNFKKVLIIGANGFLGNELLQFKDSNLLKEQELSFLAADVMNNNIQEGVSFIYLDITKKEKVVEKIIKFSPEVVILTAAMTNVDQNELNKDLAQKINTEGPKNVIKACQMTNSKLVFVSTDFVFDGISKNGDYIETDIPNPLSHYGKTKYGAEKEVISSEIEYLICRTAVLYGWNKERHNFITWILNKLKSRQTISIVTNQINNATLARNLAQIILMLVKNDAKGIYHTAGPEPLSRYEMAIKCAEVFEYDKKLVSPIDNLRQVATRPRNAGLNIDKLKREIGKQVEIFNLNQGLNYMKYNKPD